MVTEIYIYENTPLKNVLKMLGYAPNTTINHNRGYIDNERVYDNNKILDFVMTHEKDRLYDKFRYTCIFKKSYYMRIGGSLNPAVDKYGEKFIIHRITYHDDIENKFGKIV